MNEKLILVVEDEERLAGVMCDYLHQAGFETHHFSQGLGVEAWVDERQPALLLLDLNLPGRDGLDICREVRKISQVPIIMLTARVEEIDRLLGLELGADDYMCKPYSPREVVARVRAVLRRTANSLGPDTSAPARAADLNLDEQSLRVTANGHETELTRVEFYLLHTLAQQPGRIYSRSELMDRIYSDGRLVSDRTVDSHVKKLRKKLLPLFAGKDVLHSVYGAGYRFEWLNE